MFDHWTGGSVGFTASWRRLEQSCVTQARKRQEEREGRQRWFQGECEAGWGHERCAGNHSCVEACRSEGWSSVYEGSWWCWRTNLTWKLRSFVGLIQLTSRWEMVRVMIFILSYLCRRIDCTYSSVLILKIWDQRLHVYGILKVFISHNIVLVMCLL